MKWIIWNFMLTRKQWLAQWHSGTEEQRVKELKDETTGRKDKN